MKNLSQYCSFPILEAHFILTQKAVDEIYGRCEPQAESTETVIALLLQDAQNKGQTQLSLHLEKALQCARGENLAETNIIPIGQKRRNSAT